MRGIVIKSTGSSYLVHTDDGKTQECIIKGNFRIKGIKSTNPVAVGDYVKIAHASEDTPAYIVDIEERRNYIIRRSSNLSKLSHILACNLDMCLLVVTINHPETSTVFIDRFLASARAYRIPVTLLFNKVDLYNETELERMNELITLYRSIGYECLICNALQGDGIEEINNLLKDNVTLISGNSGVGKSTLINRLLPNLNLRTSQISEKHNTGMHTTTFSEMFPLPYGGWIIDSPGIKGFGLYDMNPEEISHYFTEIFEYSDGCKYGNCTHTNEPHCAVKKAVEDGKISISRYASYLSMLEDDEEGKYRSN
ncbi:MAG: ribosome small subunit-dependent GTPase A [Bacteroidaceae bacterium]|nr:ribosome small subunit-dependent GTPase A [Bacteroidaceae bacterium]MBO7247602.1 ribosome small subunit-dependent GTPase A [Bacteroidaceae bacterium]